jgi:hypothetical protein
MTTHEAQKWKEALYGIKPEPVIEKPTPTNIIYVPVDFWRRYHPKKSA